MRILDDALDQVGRLAVGSAGEGRRQNSVGSLDRMLQKNRSDSPEEEMIVVVGLRRALKLGSWLWFTSRAAASLLRRLQCWYQTRGIVGQDKEGEQCEAGNGSNGCDMG